jgi:hypothetical protein
MEKTSQTTNRDLLGKSLDRRKTNKVNFEIPNLTIPTFWILAPSLENSALFVFTYSFISSFLDAV